MFVLIDFRAIIAKHYETLKLDSPLRFRILNFFLIPILLSILFIFYNKLLTQNSVNDLVTAYTLFTGFLLSIIFVLFGIDDKLSPCIPNHDAKKALLQHLYANSLYSLLISMTTLVLLIIIAITELWQKPILFEGVQSISQNLAFNASLQNNSLLSRIHHPGPDYILILASFITLTPKFRV